MYRLFNQVNRNWAAGLLIAFQLVSYRIVWAQETQSPVPEAEQNPAVDTSHVLFKNKLSVFPVVASSPETGLVLGVAGSCLFKPKGVDSLTRISNALLSAIYTFKHQALVSLSYTAFTNHERYMLIGVTGYENFTLYSYGIGNTAPVNQQEVYGHQEFWARQSVLRRIGKKLFIGGGYRLDYYYDFTVPDGGWLATHRPIGYRGSNSSGLLASLIYDSRDNVLNASRGKYFELTYNPNLSALAATSNYQVTRLDARWFYTLFKKRKDVLAFQLYGLQTTSRTPFMDLAQLGGSMIMRGYYLGRYRDHDLAAVQTEYRAVVYRWLGVVGFIATGRVAEELTGFKLKGFYTSKGVGLRVALPRLAKERINLRLDYAWGEGSQYAYFGVAEAF